MDFNKLVEEIKREEGSKIVNGKHVVYKDHLGFDTIGFGRLCDARRGGGITEWEANQLLENDLHSRIMELDKRIPWINTLSDERQRALINMSFQIGVNGLLKFKNMLRLLQSGDYEAASQEALNSKWAKQTPLRATRVATMLKGDTL